MRKVTLLFVMMVLMLLAASGRAAVLYENDYNDQTPGAGAGGWNWTGGAVTAHQAVYEEVNGNIVIRHTGTVNNSGDSAQDSRFGSKWDITLTGNTSADPADYTISFDLRNVSGDWDPIPLELFVVTTPAAGGDDNGHGFPTVELAQADGWVRVEFNLADFTKNWWQGTDWDLTQSRWSLEVGMPWPGLSVPAGESWTQVWEMDNLKIIMGSDIEPHDPVVLPDNDDGTVGTLISQAETEVTLGWMAGGDPNTAREYPVNPDTLGYYIYLSLGGEDDPNLYPLDYVEQVHAEDPYETDPYNEYGPILLGQSTTYYWQIEQAMDDGTGNPYGAGDPNNIIGPVWSFTTVGATPRILSGPEHAVADFDGNASFSVTTGAVATDFRWFKVGDPDTQLADGGIYSGTQTNTLVITGATVADEGEFYCIAYNGDPDDEGIASLPSPAAILWYPRLMSHYPFEVMSDEEGVYVTPDIVSGLDAAMMSDDTGEDVPVLDAGMPELDGAYALKFDNPQGDDPNTADAQFAQLPAGVADYKDITISLWIYPESLPGWARVLDFGTGTDNYLFLTADAGWGVMRFAIRTPDVDEQLLEAGALTAGEWHYVTVTITGDTGRLYHNGELVATNTGMTLDPIDVAAELNYLGKSQWPDPYFNGRIDDLKIYNYARTTEQIAQDYLAVRGDWVCNYELYDLPFDFDGDCMVGLADFAIFAETWLDHYRIYPE